MKKIYIRVIKLLKWVNIIWFFFIGLYFDIYICFGYSFDLFLDLKDI